MGSDMGMKLWNPYIVDVPLQTEIHKNTKIWRYMDLEKFVLFLEGGMLFFPFTDRLSDKRELGLPVNNEKSLESDLERIGIPDVQFQMKQGIGSRLNRLKATTLISSWTMSNEESYNLWKVYLGGSNVGVAVGCYVRDLIKGFRGIDVASFSHLDRSVEKGNPTITKLNICQVEYKRHRPIKSLFDTDYELNEDLIIKTKSPFYTTENEARMYLRVHPNEMRFSEYRPGLYGLFQPEIVISDVIISPFVQSWFKESFKKLILKSAPWLDDPKGKKSIRYSQILDR
jgi:hypothetical protein